ncbi:membrane metallo-endopeptidase-like 1 [Dermacentor andersoni]|uniref:membrane metallo-endopeptidase-like 1 n=1 Tax=Dermacentor andersoni TaxID=34620 RepID=UPI00215544C8
MQSAPAEEDSAFAALAAEQEHAPADPATERDTTAAHTRTDAQSKAASTARKPRKERRNRRSVPAILLLRLPQWRRYGLKVATATACTLAVCWAIPAAIRFSVGCWQPHCTDWVAEMSNSLDLTKSPCDNFYSFVCGNDKSPLRFISKGGFVRLTISVYLSFVKRLLATDFRDPQEELSVAHRRYLQLSQRCFQQAISGGEHVDAVKAVMSEHGLSWPPEKHPSRSLLERLLELSLVRGIHVLFAVQPGVYLKGPGFYILQLGVNLPSLIQWSIIRGLLIQAGDLGSFFVRTAAVLSNKPMDPRLVERLVALDNMIMTVAMGTSLSERLNFTEQFVSFANLGNYTGEFFSGEVLLKTANNVLEMYTEPLSPEDELMLTQGPHLRLLGRLLLAQAESETVQVYTALMLARALSPAASQKLVEAQTPGNGESLIATILSLQHCLMVAVVELPYIGGDLFVQWFFPGGDMGAVHDMVARIANATREAFKTLHWIDEPTRRNALLRISSLERIVGRPENLSTTRELDEYHSFLPAAPEDITYPEMLFAMMRSRATGALRLLSPSRSVFSHVRKELPMVIVNAFYVPIYHVIVIPPAIMFSPFFKRTGVPAALNYGSLGHVIGHEITHSFDEDFGLYNRLGEREDWWSKQSRANFRDRLRCLSRLYNEVSAGTGIAFGDTALAENFADCGGMAKATQAFLSLGPQPAITLKGREFTAEQLFFLSSCYKWCEPMQDSESLRKDGKKDKLIIKYYSPMDMRCNVPLMNMPEFAVAFACANGSYMSSLNRCEVL